MASLKLPPLVLPPPSQSETPPPPPDVSRLIVPRQPFSTEDDRIRGISKRLTCGYSETTGIRKSMEDRIIIYGSLRSKEDEDYFAVFDGHNGDAAAKYCAGQMHMKLSKILEQQPQVDLVTCLKQAFHVTNEGLERARTEGGTTAVVALFKGLELYIANSGDSRAVLSKNHQATRVTTDHKPDLPEEKQRIEKTGGWVKNGGITGTLTVSRSLGDFSYKPYITCEPDVFGPFSVNDEEYQLLILACDGLWDVVSDDEAVAIALEAKNPEEAAVNLRDKAFNSKSQDNISVLVVFFPHYKVRDNFSENHTVTTDTNSTKTENECNKGQEACNGSIKKSRTRIIEKKRTKKEKKNEKKKTKKK